MKPLSRLNTYFWKYKHLFIPGMLCAVASAGFSLMVPMVVRVSVDSIPAYVELYQAFSDSPARGEILGSVFVSLLTFGLTIILLSVVSGIFSFLMRQTVVVASRHIEYDLRNRLYAHLQNLSRYFYLEHPTGDLITRATSDIEQVRRYIGPAIMYLTRALVVVIVALIFMIIISPRLTAFAVLPMPLLAVSVFFVAKLVHERSDTLQKQYSELTTRVQESLSGIRVIKAYTREPAEAADFDDESRKYRSRMLELAMVEASFRPVFLLLIGASTIIVVWIGGQLVVEGAITIGTIAEYIIYVALMTWPVAAMGFVIMMVQRASASMVRIGKILDTEPVIRDGTAAEGWTDPVRGDLAFRGVGFRYSDDGPWVLRDVNVEVAAGSTLAIVGRTGTGKTTLVDMIPRLLDPTEGAVEIDGNDVRSLPLEVVRGAVGMVPQDVFLFSDSVAENIAFGKMEAEQPELEQAATEADLIENVRGFPEGFDTRVGERGIAVSGGQKQRISIARALIRDPRILVFDDALSAVDTRTERSILEHLRARAGDCTLVIVSHRISAVQEADVIVVLEDGTVVEQGTHEELLDQGGRYADLYRKQLLEEELEAIE